MDDLLDVTDPERTAYTLDLTPAQLKVTHAALRSMLDDFGHEERDVLRVIREVLDKLPDEASIRAIDLATELRKRADFVLPSPAPQAPRRRTDDVT
jgi:hypothetical protein